MSADSNQRDVIDLLSNPATHSGEAVERIETHASIVFLAGTRAYKLKRAVKYDYLDFSTPELRRRNCNAELEVNRRSAPMLYRRVTPIVRTAAGSLALGGEGVPVDWVVEMARFDQEALCDRMAAGGRLGVRAMIALAEEIASLHERCASRTDDGGAQGIARVIHGNEEGLRDLGNEILLPAECEALTRSATAALGKVAPLLEARRQGGLVRQCHGDLHLGNIVLLDGRPVLFDAIEFNDDIACIDVMYDLAFLLMDLWHRRLRSHANTVLNAYLAATQDVEGLAALPLFLSCRAAIRAKTTATAARLQAALTPRRVMEQAAREYLNLALRVITPGAPVIAAVGGLSGSGKSTLARRLAPAIGAVPGALIVRSDEIRKRLCGAASPLTRLGAEAYTPEMSGRVYEALADHAACIVRTGHSVVVDAVFANPWERAAIERTARSLDVTFAPVWLDAPEDVLVSRVSHRDSDASDADAKVVHMQCARWSGDVPWPRVDATGEREAVEGRARARLRAQFVAVDSAA